MKFEPVSFFSSYKEVYDGELTQKDREKISAFLYKQAKLDVEVEVAKFRKPDMVVRARVAEWLEANNYIR